MKVKTYGIYGLTEWHGKVKAGTLEASLSFVGGTCSPSGAQPAYMVTKNPITQFVIENSKEFKNGFINLVMLQELPGTDKRIATHKPVPKRIEDTDAGVEAPTPEVGKPFEDGAKVESGAESTEETTSDEFATEDNTAEAKTEVEFTDNQEAKDYIAKNFGVKPGTMRNREDIKVVGETYGVKITFVNEK